MKTKKRFYFISGLPRAGSTLLANILAQNPNFHATHTSGLADVMFNIRNQWDNLEEFQAHPDDEGKKRVLRGILESYYEPYEESVVFEKSRVWVFLFEMLEEAFGEKPKMLVPVRDVRDVLASLEKIWRKAAGKRQIDHEKKNYIQFQTVEGRCKTWMNDTPLGIAYHRIRDAVVRGHRGEMHFVEFEKLTTNPEEELKKIYEFLGEEHFQHDFENVEQVTKEDDRVRGMEGLHDIRKKIEPMEPQWPEILGHAAEPYANLSFWEKL